jgi:phosphoglycerate dehydrogenase-like enzyme
VIATKKHVTRDALPHVEVVFPTERQNECVARADYVVVAAALTPETKGMVNNASFAAMRPDAAVINIARGAVIDEPALLDALRSGKVRAAYLDVVAKEPLPPDSPIWSLPNVVVTPHNSHDSQNMLDHMAGVFVDNFGRFSKGEPLQNVVNKRTGY